MSVLLPSSTLPAVVKRSKDDSVGLTRRSMTRTK
jgi:hypothetical protein